MTPQRAPESASRRVFAFSAWDLVAVVLAVLALAVVVVGALVFNRLGLAGAIGLAVVIVATEHLAHFGHHNHVHTPIFTRSAWNAMYEALRSASDGRPSGAYRIAHHYHHAHTISYSPYGLTDWLGLRHWKGIALLVVNTVDVLGLAMLLAAAKAFLQRPHANATPPRRPASFPFSGAYFGHIVEVVKFRIASDPVGALKRRVLWQSAGCTVFRLLLLSVSWRFVVFHALVRVAIAWAASLSEFGMHYGVDASDPAVDSVSAYGRWYNRLTSNAGYHQEHHVKPGLHWTRLPSLRSQMAPSSMRRIARAGHWSNLPSPFRTPGPAGNGPRSHGTG